MNETLDVLFCANDTNLFGESEHFLWEGNGRGALLFASNEVNLVANADLKAGIIHNTEVVKQML